MKKVLLWAAICLWSLKGFAQTRISTYEDVKTDNYTVRIFENDPLKTRIYTLNNGLKVITSTNKKEPRIYTMVAVKTGSKNDPKDHTGLAHYLEHMLFKGTDKYGTQNWEEEKKYLQQIDELYEQYNSTKDESQRTIIYRKIDSVSALAAKFSIANEYDKMCNAMGANGTNAFTSFEQTVYLNDIPSNKLHQWILLEAERFRNPILRLFHTELEAVYEEKNISMDRDNSKVFEKLFAELFKSHNYGLQTTIGTIEHLKNPSLKAIREYYQKYYVPNNMAIILCGDFDPDAAVDGIVHHFGYMQSKPVPTYTFDQEWPRASPKTFEVYGPDPEYLMIGYRLPGAGTKEAMMAKLVDLLLNNSSAGLIDIDLVKQQKVQSAGSGVEVLKDYSVFILNGKPKNGQTLEEVKDLLYAEMQKISKGEFDTSMLAAVLLNQEISRIREWESNDGRAYFYQDVFSNGLEYNQAYNELWKMRKVTKLEIMEFAKEYLALDHVVIFKKQGEDTSIHKIVKPEIHPVELNRDKTSGFVTEWLKDESDDLQPVFINPSKDLIYDKVGIRDIWYKKNEDHRLFSLQWVLPVGKWSDKVAGIYLNYLNYAGSKDLTQTAFSSEMYKLGCKFSSFSSNERSFLSLEGPEENYDAALKLLNTFLSGLNADQEVLNNLVERELKGREDAVKDKIALFRALSDYALYGNDNPTRYVLTNQELRSLQAASAVKWLKGLFNLDFDVMYFGQRDIQGVKNSLVDKFTIASFNSSPISSAPIKIFTPLKPEDRTVYFVSYPMVQAFIGWNYPQQNYSLELLPIVTAFNQYFGGDMSSVVFQNIREAKALAYSTNATYNKPNKANKPFIFSAFVGTQSDKFHEAIKAMEELLKDLPADEQVFSYSKENILNQLKSERIINENVFGYVLAMLDMQHTEDPRSTVYAQVAKLQMKDIEQFHKKNIKGKPFNLLVVADDNRIGNDDLNKHGKVVKLTPSQLFGF